MQIRIIYTCFALLLPNSRGLSWEPRWVHIEIFPLHMLRLSFGSWNPGFSLALPAMHVEETHACVLMCQAVNRFCVSSWSYVDMSSNFRRMRVTHNLKFDMEFWPPTKSQRAMASKSSGGPPLPPNIAFAKNFAPPPAFLSCPPPPPVASSPKASMPQLPPPRPVCEPKAEQLKSVSVQIMGQLAQYRFEASECTAIDPNRDDTAGCRS